MNAAHAHLLLNHVPVIGTLFVTALLAAAYLRRSEELARVALASLVVLAVATVAVFLTGEPAEDLVKNLPGLSEPTLEAHEASAKVALISMVVVGIAAALSLLVMRRSAFPRWLTAASLAATLGVALAMAYTAGLGGQIRHSEIRGTPGWTPGDGDEDRGNGGRTMSAGPRADTAPGSH